LASATLHLSGTIINRYYTNYYQPECAQMRISP